MPALVVLVPGFVLMLGMGGMIEKKTAARHSNANVYFFFTNPSKYVKSEQIAYLKRSKNYFLES